MKNSDNSDWKATITKKTHPTIREKTALGQRCQRTQKQCDDSRVDRLVLGSMIQKAESPQCLASVEQAGRRQDGNHIQEHAGDERSDRRISKFERVDASQVQRHESRGQRHQENGTTELLEYTTSRPDFTLGSHIDHSGCRAAARSRGRGQPSAQAPLPRAGIPVGRLQDIATSRRPTTGRRRMR